VTVQSSETGHVSDQIDLRGKRLDDAMREVSGYLDRAFRSGKNEVTIVHGLGTGALREGVRSLLKSTNYVAQYQDAGSSGATLVRFSV
jgi:DNA mismatch repair protein MutS2